MSKLQKQGKFGGGGANEAADIMKKMDLLSKNKRAARRMAKNRDTIMDLLKSVESNMKFTKMVEYSLDCLKNLAVDVVSVEEMIECGVLDTIQKILKVNPYNEKIMNIVNNTLSAFCKNEDMAKAIQKKIGPIPFVISLKKHVEPTTLQSTCKLIGQLAVDKESIDSFAKAGVIPGLAKVIKSNPNDGEVMASAADCMDKIARHGDNAVAVMQSGGVQGILKAMTQFGDNPNLVKSGLSLLSTLAYTDEKMAAELKEMGAVDVIVNALELHPEDDDVLELGARALQALAGEQDLAACLAVTPSCNLATANAIGKVAALVLVEENVDYMIHNEGVPWVTKAMTASQGDNSKVAQRILASGACTFERMAINETNIYEMMKGGAPAMLISTLNNHAAEEKVANACLGGLTNFCTRMENGDYLTQSKAVEASLQAAEHNSKSAKSVGHLLQFWERLAKDQAGQGVKRVANPDVVKRVMNFLQNHKKDAKIAKKGLQLMKHIAGTKEGMKTLGDEGAFSSICELMRAHPEDLEICQLGMELLSEAAMDPANLAALRAAGAMDAILEVMEHFPENSTVQNLGASTLAKIAGPEQLKKAVDQVQEISDKIIKMPGMVRSLIDKFNGNLGLLSHLTVVDKNIKPLVAAGAVRALIAAFEACNNLPAGPKKDRALNDAVKGIMRLAKDPEAAKEIVKSGALAKIMKVGLANPENEELCELTMQLAADLLTGHGDIKGVAKLTSVDDIISMAKLHPYNEKILASCAAMLSTLMTSDDAIRGILKSGGAGVVVESCMLNMENPEILSAGLAMITQMAIDEEAVKALIAAGALDAILEAMRRYPGDPNIIGACVQALCRLLINEEVAQAIGDKEGIPLLVAAMRTHFAVESICEVDMIVMDSLASVEANAERLLVEELQTVDLVKWIMTKYEPNTALVEAGERLLKTICGLSDADLVFSDESMKLDADACQVLLDRITSGELDDNQMKLVLDNIAALCQHPYNAKMMVKQGGMQALAKVMKDYKDNSIVFPAAAAAFATLCEHLDDDDLEILEDPNVLAALCQILNPSDKLTTPLDLNILAKALGALSRVKLKPELIEEMLKNVPLESLMNLLANSDDPLLLQQLSKLLGKLSNDEEQCEKMAQINDLRGLIMAMRRNIQNQEFLKYGVYLLANLAVDDEIKNQVGIEGGIQLILQIMTTHPQNEGLIENCTYATSGLSYECDVNVQFIVACKGIQTFLLAMQTHPDAEELLDGAVTTLCNISLMNDINKDYIIRDDGAMIIVETILNKFNAIELLQTCLNTLGNLAYNTEMSSAIIKAGAVQGIVAGLTVHSEEAEVIDISVRVLTNLSSELDEENQEIMAQEGAVQAIVEVVENCRDNLELEVSAVGCLHNLSQAPYNAEMIIKQQGLEVVMETMKELSFDEEFTEVALGLLHNLTQMQSEVDTMLDLDLVSAVNTSIQTHHTNEDITTMGVRVVSNLAFNKSCAKRVYNKGALEPIMKIIEGNQSKPELLKVCFGALSNISRPEDCAVAMATSTAALCETTLKKAEEYAPMSAVLAYLANLCVTTEASKSIINTQLIEVILERAHPWLVKNANVIKRACRVLENISYANQTVRDNMKDRNCTLLLARWKNAIQDDVKLAVQAVIDAINREETNLGEMKVLQMGPLRAAKSAKDLFGDNNVKKEATLSKETRNFLQGGAMLMKHSKSAAPRGRHVYVTDDLKWLVWKDPKKKLSGETQLKIFKIKQIEAGRCTPQLQRKGGVMGRGKFLAKEECCFAIFSRDRESLDLECDSEADKTKWISCLEELTAYVKAEKESQRFNMGV